MLSDLLIPASTPIPRFPWMVRARLLSIPIGSGGSHRVGSRYDAVILARSPSELPVVLTERLVDIHFHQTPVFTVDAFFESHWRRVYLRGVSPEWLFQEGFHLTRRSATSHLKRLIDIAVSAAALTVLVAVCSSLIAAAIRLEDRGRRSSGSLASACVAASLRF